MIKAANYVLGLMVIVLTLSALKTEGSCTLPPDPGPCKAKITRWFFNTKTGECETFRYGGCQGNRNRYRSALLCELSCRSRALCYLPRDVGPCEAYHPRWAYNLKTQQCQQFIYGGCFGNDNRFLTEDDCSNRCVNTCLLPKEQGPCKGAFERWYHNSTTRECEQFIYGGCKGNRNNFMTKDDCQARC